ncbi:MAG TPA: hypothetical protein VH721_09595 [Gaiellaceae bacterium]
MARITDLLRSPFAFLFTRSQKEELVAGYVIREHRRGRALEEILDDHYVTNRLNPDQISRLFDRPDIIQALGEDIAAEHKSKLASETTTTG